MRVIIKHTRKKNSNVDIIVPYIPKRSTQYSELLKELWEKEYNAWFPEPDKERTWLEEDQGKIEDDTYVTEFFITNVVEV